MNAITRPILDTEVWVCRGVGECCFLVLSLVWEVVPRWEFGRFYLNFVGISARHALVRVGIARDALYASWAASGCPRFCDSSPVASLLLRGRVTSVDHPFHGSSALCAFTISSDFSDCSDLYCSALCGASTLHYPCRALHLRSSRWVHLDDTSLVLEPAVTISFPSIFRHCAIAFQIASAPRIAFFF
jgi:hypothetical protein